ncbi:MAG TPA: hypothetical protein VGB63_10315 [Pedobacter sp.]|jgi:hypothetical protein
MKILIIITLVLAGTFSCPAQTFDELFNQKSTQKKYLLEQIAALKVYQGYLSKGYSIVKDGLGTIKKIKSGEIGLHDLYFESLKNINPAVAGSAKVKDILRLQAVTASRSRSAKKVLNSAALFSQEEKKYISEVYSRLSDDCTHTLDQLINVTTSGRFEMTDDQRLRRIEDLYRQSLSQYQFANSFKNDALLLLSARQKEQNDISLNRSINGLKND